MGDATNQYRLAADKISDMAREYYDQGQRELAAMLEEIVIQLHSQGRKEDLDEG